MEISRRHLTEFYKHQWTIQRMNYAEPFFPWFRGSVKRNLPLWERIRSKVDDGDHQYHSWCGPLKKDQRKSELRESDFTFNHVVSTKKEIRIPTQWYFHFHFHRNSVKSTINVLNEWYRYQIFIMYLIEAFSTGFSWIMILPNPPQEWWSWWEQLVSFVSPEKATHKMLVAF